jgi:ATP-dependent helicase/nuclease subunit B
MAMALNLFAIPPGIPFLDALATGWLSERGADPLDIATGLILTPTRRAARSLAEAFLRVSSGVGLLLPRIVALGGIDEAPLTMEGALDLPPAVDPHRRLAVLSDLILRMNGAGGAPRAADRAWMLAAELASLMDEADRAEIDLAARLPDAAAPEFAAHWARTLEFLHIVTHAWPDWLAENGVMNPAARQVALLNAQATAWETRAPDHPVVIAGTTAGIPAVARLARVVARMPVGRVVLPVLDTLMSDSDWAAMEDSHPQSGLANLLAGLDATREDVRWWGLDGVCLDRRPDTLAGYPRPLDRYPGSPDRHPGSLRRHPRARPGDLSPQRVGDGDPRVEPGDDGGGSRDDGGGSQDDGGTSWDDGGGSRDDGGTSRGDGGGSRDDDGGVGRSGDNGNANGRFALLSRALLPAASLSAWQDKFTPSLHGLWRLKPRDAQEEAEAIAMILRQAVETPGRTAALVTPDRELAGRVSAALPRHGIVADDSAGEKLIETPPAVLLRLLARAVAEELAPVPLLALLKHPLAAAGLNPVDCRQHARALELAALRGPRPAPGLAGLRRAIAGSGEDLNAFLTRVETCLEPALRFAASVELAPVDALAALIAAAENLAATDTEPGAARLWGEAEGDALATQLTGALNALPHLPDQRGEVMPGLLDALLQGEMVRSRRALRGRGGAEHPRLFIWGPLEARLQSVDVMVLGGLVETVWPPAPEPGPWLSRPMRATVGLPSPEVEIGLAAHDFLAAVVSAPEVILSCPDRRDGAPAVPARWLTRLDALLNGLDVTLPLHPAAAWARGLDLPSGGPKPVSPPRPCPPVEVRPSRLSVTEIETWLRDPYAIYAKHILRLPKLRDLDQETDAADYGTLVHDGLRIFLREHGIVWPADADEQMRRALRRALAESYAREALAAWWEPRLDRIATWVADAEQRRRGVAQLAAIETEIAGRVEIQRPGRRFRLVARADRIERWTDGRLAILDYKTGIVPSQKAVAEGIAPQLPLEAAMAEAGGFGPELQAATADLTYWQLTGGYEPGKASPLFKGNDADLAAAIGRAIRGLEKLIDEYDRPDQPYLAHPHPSWTPRFSDYAQLERFAEWSAAAEEDDA